MAIDYLKKVLGGLVILYGLLFLFYGQNTGLSHPAEFKDTEVPERSSIEVGKEIRISRQNSRLHHVESQMVIHPGNPDVWLVTSMIITNPANWKIEAAVWRTDDAGHTWSKTSFPYIFADPWLSIQINGTVYFSGLGNRVNGQQYEYYFISRDGGENWSEPQKIEKGHDHPFLLSLDDETYWYSTTRGNRILNLKKAENGGIFENLRSVNFNNNLRHDNMIPGLRSDGTLLLPFSRYNSSRAGIESFGTYLYTSRDGLNLDGPYKITDRKGSGKGLASLLADRSDSRFKDNLYFLYAVGEFRRSDGIGISVSEDGGKSWKDGMVRRPFPRNQLFYVPTGAVNNEGIIGVYWYQRGNDRRIINNDIYFSYSKDGGHSFSDPVRVTKRSSRLIRSGSNARVAGAFSGGGHYSGIATLPDGSFQLVWSDARSGTYQLYTSNISIK